MSNIGKTYEDEQANLFLETKTKIVNNVFELFVLEIHIY